MKRRLYAIAALTLLIGALGVVIILHQPDAVHSAAPALVGR